MTDCPTAKLGLAGVTPWGRRAFEYRAFFGLTDDQLPGPILDRGAGPSSFTAEMTRAGSRVVAMAPIYRLKEFELQRIFALAEGRIAPALAAEQQRFIWDFYGDIDDLLRVRREAAELFLADFPEGVGPGPVHMRATTRAEFCFRQLPPRPMFTPPVPLQRRTRPSVPPRCAG